MKKIKAIVVGCGKMGAIGARYLQQKGIDIVGAVDTERYEGVLLSDVANLSKPCDIRITSDIDELLSRVEADIAVSAVFSSMEANEPIWTKLINKGINIITTCDESHYAWNTVPEVTQRLNNLCIKNGVSLVGCGFQDVFWLHIVHTAAGGIVDIKEIHGNVINNSEDYGPSLSEAFKVGFTINEFNEAVKKEFEMGGVGALTQATNEALCAKFGFHPIDHKIEVLPYIKDIDVYSDVLKKTIPAGNAVGTTEKVTTITEEGVTIVNAYNIFIYDEKTGEYDITSWHIEGEPSVDIDLPRGLTAQLTMSTIINRIPDAINATPGYHPNVDLGAAVYRAGEITL